VIEPAYRDEFLTVYGGECRAVMAEMAPDTVDCVVTSPPYWNLRDYRSPDVSWADGWVGQLGLEPDPDQYIEHLLEVMREVRRVLAPAGTLWLNLGDSYAAKARGSDEGWDRSRLSNPGQQQKRQGAALRSNGQRHRGKSAGLKAKDLVGIPWAVAFALRADGWYLRSDIVWAKPNPQPESITDRPTRSHEYVFLLTKSGNPLYWTHRDGRRVERRPPADFVWQHRETGEERRDPGPKDEWMRVNLWEGHDYYYDADSIRERFESSPSDLRKMAEGRERIGGLTKEQTDPLLRASGLTNIGRRRSVGNADMAAAELAKRPSGWNDGPTELDRLGRYSDGRWPRGWASAEGRGHDPQVGRYAPPGNGVRQVISGRTRRSVWTVATEPYPEAHFATFPRKLVEPMILAGSPVDGVVLDPFGGSGTVGLVARHLRRSAILVELNPAYVSQAIRRATGGYADPGDAIAPDDSLWALTEAVP
jgi:site-specific DNA-methyltransferase (adenine-specific)